MQLPVGSYKVRPSPFGGQKMPEMRAADRQTSAVLIEREGSFFVYEPSLGLIGSGETAEVAYQKFQAARRNLMADVERAGLTMEREGSSKPGLAAELGIFIAKACIVMVLIVAIGAIGAVKVIQSAQGAAVAIGNALGSGKTISMVDVVHKSGEVAHDLQSLSDDNKKALLSNIGIVSRELTPYVEAWRNPPDNPTK